ncbi:unnamed protein product [Ixodes persulcatus]
MGVTRALFHASGMTALSRKDWKIVSRGEDTRGPSSFRKAGGRLSGPSERDGLIWLKASWRWSSDRLTSDIGKPGHAVLSSMSCTRELMHGGGGPALNTLEKCRANNIATSRGDATLPLLFRKHGLLLLVCSLVM